MTNEGFEYRFRHRFLLEWEDLQRTIADTPPWPSATDCYALSRAAELERERFWDNLEAYANARSNFVRDAYKLAHAQAHDTIQIIPGLLIP